MPSIPSHSFVGGRLYCCFVLLILSVGIVTNSSAQQEPKQSPWGTKFLLYTPPGYDGSTPAPMLIYLHGGASIGNDLTKLTNPATSDKAPPSLIANSNQYSWPTSRPFIVVSPQLKRNLNVPVYNDQVWNVDSINEVLEYVKTLKNINPNKIYLTGMSLGGAACWSFAAAYPSKVAAIVPLSGKTDSTQACLIKDIPIWAFHGSNDGLVDLPYTVNMVHSVKACAGAYKPKLNVLLAKIHEGWNEVWNGTDGYPVFDWMLQYTKGDLSNKGPFVSAGDNIRMLQRSEPIHLYGDYFDFDGTVVTVAWVQTGGAALTLANTNSKILEIQNAPVGNYAFELRVTDDDGVQSIAPVTLQIAAAPGVNEPVITDLVLLDGATDTDIVSLTEGYVINKATLETNQFNIRATGNAKTVSIVMSVNADQNTKTNNGTTALIRQQIPGTEWTIDNGTYIITATPYTGSQGAGTAGISRSFKVVVTGNFIPLTPFYAEPGKDLTNIANWGIKTDGTGTQPASFSTNYQNFIMPNTATLSSPLTISGTNSVLTVAGTGNFTINSTYTGKLNVEGAGVVNVNTNQPFAFGKVSSNSMITFGSVATQIPGATYGSIKLSGSGTTKTLATDSTFVKSNITIDAGVTLNGAANGSSVLALSNNFNIDETGIFSPPTKFKVFLKGQTTQQLLFKSSKVAFNSLEVRGGCTAQFINPITNSKTTLELGSATGGGITLNDGSRLELGKHDLSIIGKGTINSLDQNGELSFKKSSNISIVSSSNLNSFLYATLLNDSVNTLNVNLSGGTSLNIMKKLYIVDSIKMYNGTTNANASISLVSTPTKTARVGRNEGTGFINGSVEYQRYLEIERLYKYLSFPVHGLTVSDIQSAIPVTGTFTGSSTGPGLSTNPSMYLYDDPDWVAYPVTSNMDTLQLGRGYSIYIRNNTADSKLQVLGSLRQGDFNFPLSADPNEAVSTDGWNLIGNPYASSIKWGTTGWNSSGLNDNIYIRDNSFPGGKFFVWNRLSGGDPEFAGIIPSGQAFYIQSVASAPTPVLTIHETAKTSTGSGALFRTSSEPTEWHTLSVELAHKGLYDRTYITTTNAATNNYDRHTDAIKQKNGFFNISSLSDDQYSLAINKISSADCAHHVGLKLDATEEGEYSLLFKGDMFELPSNTYLLHDSFRDSIFTFSDNSVYKFQLTGDSLSRSKSRFKIVISNEQVVKPVVTVINATLHSSAATGNQWVFNGNPIEGATGSTYAPGQAGEYQVVVTSSCAITSDPISYIVTGKEDELSIDDIRLFPNPAEKFIRVKTERDTHTDVNYSIVDLLGREIQKGTIPAKDMKMGADVYFNDDMKPGMHVMILSNMRFNSKHRFISK